MLRLIKYYSINNNLVCEIAAVKHLWLWPIYTCNPALCLRAILLCGVCVCHLIINLEVSSKLTSVTNWPTPNISPIMVIGSK